MKRARTRSRRARTFTPAEIQFLTGRDQDGANRFETMDLEIRTKPEHIRYAEELVERAVAAGIIDAERAADLRKMLARDLARMRRMYPEHPAFTES